MNATQTEPTVFVVDDDQEMRRSFKWLIESVRLPVEVFACAEAFIQAFDPNRPGCLLLDVRMPGMGGLRLLDWLRSQGAHLPVIVFTGHGDISMAVDTLKGGAFHFIEKPASRQQILHCIQDALALDRDFRTRASKQAAIEARLAQLTPRERGVLERVVEGEPNKCIAIDLGITERTVEKHRGSIMEKMGTRSLAKLMQMIFLCRRDG
jgi:two-component system, LuxR family, response regulator FixJ